MARQVTVGEAREPSSQGGDVFGPASLPVALPKDPLVRIRPSRGWVSLDLRELWAYRELFFFLTWRDVKVRYKQTVIGIAWALLQPLLTMVIFTVFFGRLAGIPSDGIPYPLFALTGLLVWTYFANAINNSGNSLVGSTNLITKVYFPRMIIPCAAVLAGLVDLAISLALLAAMMVYYGAAVSWGVLLLPAVVALATLLSVAVGMFTSALNVKYRDVRYALPFFVQVWMFVSPVIFPLSLVPARWRPLLALNPMTGVIENFRACLFSQKSFDWGALAYSVTITALLLVISLYAFRRMDKQFADVA